MERENHDHARWSRIICLALAAMLAFAQVPPYAAAEPAHPWCAEQSNDYWKREWLEQNGRQAKLNAALDAIRAKDWKHALEGFRWLVENTLVSESVRRDLCKNTNLEMLERFTAVIPAYIFSNQALASDALGTRPLMTAELYRASMAYDPQAHHRSHIERRIAELEHEHKAYLRPICNVVEALAARLAASAIHTNDELFALDHTQRAVADCVRALVLVNDLDHARTIEAGLRSRFFSVERLDGAFLDLAYARAYRLLGREGDAGSHGARAIAASKKGTQIELSLEAFFNREEVRQRPAGFLSSWVSLLDTWWAAGRAGSALFWLLTTRGVADPGYGKAGCAGESLDDINGFLAANYADPGQIGFHALALKVENHACAAISIANYWLYYQQKLEHWKNKLAGKG